MTLTNNIIQLGAYAPRNTPGSPYALGSYGYPNAGDPVVCEGVEVEVGVVDSVCMDEVIITYYPLYYCDAETRKIYEVRLTPQPVLVHDSICVYDVDRAPSAWYMVVASRLGRSEKEAAYRARDAIASAIWEKAEELRMLQDELSALRELQAMGVPGA
jgi:hypothetical protein